VLWLEGGVHLCARSLQYGIITAGHEVIRAESDYEEYKETFAYIERLGLPKADTDKILHHNAQALFGLRH
jgi:hypothetical protein